MSRRPGRRGSGRRCARRSRTRGWSSMRPTRPLRPVHAGSQAVTGSAAATACAPGITTGGPRRTARGGPVRRHDRSPLGASAAQPELPRRAVPIRLLASRPVPVTRPAVGAVRTPRPDPMVRLGTTADQATRRAGLCDPGMRVVAASIWAVLSRPPRDVARERTVRGGRVRRAVRRHPSALRPGHRPDPAG